MGNSIDNAGRASVSDLATRLSREIAERRLVPGDRFLTADQAARFLQVRRDRANRALQVLVQRGEIERSQRIGARVAKPRRSAPPLERVHILVQEDHEHVGPVISPGTQVGLHSALPGADVQVDVIPTGGAQEFLDPLLRRALRESRPEAVVLVRCDYPTQRLVANSGLAAVVFGTTYAGLSLSSVDVDGAQMGALQVQSLAANGCERLVVLRRDRSLPGDRVFMSGLRSTAARLGFAADAITELEIAPYTELIQSELVRLLDGEEPLGLICATKAFADAAWSLAHASHRTVGDDLWIHANHVGSSRGAPPYPFLLPVDGAEAQGARLGELLAKRVNEPTCALEHLLVPCRLVSPEGPA